MDLKPGSSLVQLCPAAEEGHTEPRGEVQI